MEFLNDVEQVESEQDSRHPEACAGAEIEPASPRVITVFRHDYAQESDEIQNL